MKLLRVEAVAFGPFAGEWLELSPRMNVLYGPNEAGKSSWHAAMYAGICGRRRNARKKEEVEFAERHRPWDDGAWAVNVLIELEGGRKIELRQDLDDPAASRALDPDLNRDITSQLLSEGAPDASTLLGLSRETMFATSTVRQAEIVRVQAEADSLQNQLQAATSKAGADSTAEAAIRRIEEYKSEQVGLRRTNSTRPLQTAINRVDDAERRLEKAQEAHRAYLELVAEREVAEAEVGRWEHKLRAARYLECRMRLERERQRLERARELFARLPAGDAPDLEAMAAEEDRIREALTRYEARPDPPETPEGLSAEELARTIAALPPMPEGDTEPSPEVEEAHEAWREARETVAAHERYRPEDPSESEESEADPTELRRWADYLDAPEPSSDEEIDVELEALYQRRGPDAGRIAARVVGTVLLAAALVLLLQGYDTPWWTIPGVLGAVALVVGFRPREAQRALDREIMALEARRANLREQRRSHRQMREAAEDRLAELDLPADPERLREITRRAEGREGARKAFETWAEMRGEYEEKLRRSEAALEQVLSGRVGLDEGERFEVEKLYERYRSECAERRKVAQEAGRRSDLEEKLSARRALEANIERDHEKRAAAERAIIELADELTGEPTEEVGDAADEPGVATARLRARLAEIERELPTWRQAERDATELEGLLDGRELAELEAEVEALEASVAEEPEGLEAEGSEPVDLGDDPAATVAEIQQAYDEASRSLASREGQVAEREQRIPSVPEAEEALALARAELARAERLEATLEKTLEFLGAARERVQRLLAPRLREALEADLATVTGGHYTKARVDPSNLEITVREPGGEWRSAALLSHGTTEQIYLLLRLALVRHICALGEPSPVFLDDPTVQCDTPRTHAILDVLQALSREHQIILFSQEEEVRRWAAERADGDELRLIELQGPAARS